MKATENLAEQIKIVVMLKRLTIINSMHDEIEKAFEELPYDDNKSTQWSLRDVDDANLPHSTQETMAYEKSYDPAVVTPQVEFEAAKVAFDKVTKKENVIKRLK